MNDIEQAPPFPIDLLGLDDIKITDIKVKNREIIVKVESIKKEIKCRRCGSLTYYHSKDRTLILRHLPAFGKKTYIEIIPPIGICSGCDRNSTTMQILSWYSRDGHYTKTYEQHLLLSLINNTITEVCINEELSKNAIKNLIDKHINNKANWKVFKHIRATSFDEIVPKDDKDLIPLLLAEAITKLEF
jgi:hypothetical protein